MAKNTTTTALSANAKAIVDAFINQNIFEPHRANALVIELYSRRKDADQDIIAQAKSNLLPCSLTLTEEQYLVLDAEYDDVVKYCHNFIVGLEKAQLNSSFTHFPSELVELCSKIISCKEEESVYLPYAGYCDMAYALDAKTVTGFEVNPSSVAFNTILFGAYGIDGGITRSDSSFPEINKGQKYDHIISFPPHLSAKENRSIAEYALELLQNNLSDGGDMSLILPLGDMSSLSWISFRRYLLQNETKYNVMTISLPAVFLPVTGVKFCLMVIEKAKNPDGTFFFMDADRKEFYTESKENRRQPLLKVDSILESIRVRDEKYIREIVVKDNQLFYNGYSNSFAPSRYFVYDNLPELKEGYEYYTLRQLVRQLEIPGMAENELAFGRRPGRYIRISCLYDNSISCDIDYSSITSAPIPTSAYCGFANGAYVGFVNGKVKVGQIKGMYSSSGRFDDNDPYSDSTIIYIDGNIAHFAPKQNGSAQQDYILRELMSDYVLDQAKKLAFGTVKQEIKAWDFYMLKIAVPPIEVQDEILKQDRIDAVAKAELKLNEAYEKYRKAVRLRKHALSQSVSALSALWNAFDTYRKEHDSISEDDFVSRKQSMTVADLCDNISCHLKTITAQTDAIADVKFDWGKIDWISLPEFVSTYIRKNKNPGYVFIYQGSNQEEFHGFHEDQGKNAQINTDRRSFEPGYEEVRIPRKALEHIVNNIVANAVAHGFPDKTRDDYKIRFEWEDGDGTVALYISNNGAPLHSELDPEAVLEFGASSALNEDGHSGLGGYEIASIMEQFGGSVAVLSTPNEEYTVTYKLVFTQVNIYLTEETIN